MHVSCLYFSQNAAPTARQADRSCWRYFFPLWCNILTRSYAVSLLKFLDHIRRHTIVLLWTSRMPSQIFLRDNTQHKQDTDSHAPGGIRTRIPSKQTAADSSRRLRGSRDLLSYKCAHLNTHKCERNFIMNFVLHHLWTEGYSRIIAWNWVKAGGVSFYITLKLKTSLTP